MKTSNQIRQSFIDFWESSPRNAKQVPNASLVPNNDPTLLFVNSGMFPLVPYLAGEPHPLGKRVFNVQRCIRTIDIEEVGDYSHLTLFEMIGNWSLGDFSKKDQIPWMFDLYVNHFGLDPKRCYVSVWEGDETVGRDDEAIEIWKETFAKYGIEAEYSDDISKIPPTVEDGENWKYRIFPFGKADNWWQRGPDTPGELGGPTSELFYDLGKDQYKVDERNINDDSGRFLEVGNSVFMEYEYGEDGKWHELAQKNIDFGGGFERIIVAAQDKLNIYETDVFEDQLRLVEEISGKKYDYDDNESQETIAFRIVVEHARSATFIIADGVHPSNKDQGYILRRLIRRMVRQARYLGIEENFGTKLAESFIENLGEAYPHLVENKDQILKALDLEETKFRRTLEKGLKEFDKIKNKEKEMDGKTAFWMYETYGFPVEMFVEELKADEKLTEKIMDEFNSAQEAHQAKSRKGAEKKFKGGLADQSEVVTRLHTAHHLLLAALQKVLGHHVHQKGSNITGERLRIDFSHANKLTEVEVKEVEKIVNEQMEKGCPVFMKTLPIEIAEKLGAEMEFGAKYGDMVNVYFIVDSSVDVDLRNPDIDSIPEDMIISKEFCGGPHVENTSELLKSGKFKIKKQESSGAGVRRIKGVLVG